MNREKLKQELIRDEGDRHEAYQDTVGLWTIGVGHLLGKEKRMIRISAIECDALLERDIEDAMDLARRFVPEVGTGTMRDARERAVINMAFNLGPRLGQFRKFLAAVNTFDWETAAVEMMDSKWATQVGMRAVRLRNMIRMGD